MTYSTAFERVILDLTNGGARNACGTIGSVGLRPSTASWLAWWFERMRTEAKTSHTGPKILKICTFKVKPKFRGEKLGELFLKQILWFAQKNSYDLVYLTEFKDQAVLIRVLEYFGFKTTGTISLDEQIYEKPRRLVRR
jgi:GNAT superfamily N-acetyltransferase